MVGADIEARVRRGDEGTMSTWAEFASAEPAFADRVRKRFTEHKHHTMATLRRDGSPRISGTEVDLGGGQLTLGMMGGVRRAGDLRRDPRVAIHSHTADPPADGGDPSSWCGDAKVAGRAYEMPAEDGQDGAHRFRVEIEEVVHTRVGVPADHLVIEVWRPARGVRRIERRDPA